MVNFMKPKMFMHSEELHNVAGLLDQWVLLLQTLGNEAVMQFFKCLSFKKGGKNMPSGSDFC